MNTGRPRVLYPVPHGAWGLSTSNKLVFFGFSTSTKSPRNIKNSFSIWYLYQSNQLMHLVPGTTFKNNQGMGSSKYGPNINQTCLHSNIWFVFGDSDELPSSFRIFGFNTDTYCSRFIFMIFLKQVKSEMPPWTTYILSSIRLANGSQLNTSL